MSFPTLVLILVAISTVVDSQTIVKTLPGYSGELPFTLETGYVGVGDTDEVELFYYFIESEGNVDDDPVFLWLTGGPGCSALSGLIYEIGPLQFDYTNSSGGLPTLVLNPYSWTKVASIIFVDAPVGTGFSYSKSFEGYNVTDTISAFHLYNFLRKWLIAHSKFIKNPLYITGDSYSGIIVPQIVSHIIDGLKNKLRPPMNLKGYVLGNPVTDTHLDLNARIQFAYMKALIPDAIYKSLKESCNGEYIYVDPSNAACTKNIDIYSECVAKVFPAQILEPTCSLLSPKPKSVKWDMMTEDHIELSLPSKRWCRVYNYIYIYTWANDKTVRDALQIREGSITEWTRCNESLTYTADVSTSIEFQRKIINNGYRILIYSGDHDMVIPYIATHAWIDRSVNLTIAQDWAPWFVDGQVAGYTIEYQHEKTRLVFATVKGGGHTAVEYKPQECFAMIDRWLAYYPL